MRVAIIGTCDAAIAVRGLVQRDGDLVRDDGSQADIVITIEEGPVDVPTIDGIDGPVELKIHQQIGLHTPSRKVTTVFGGAHKASDRDIRITVPANSPAESHAVERGVYQGLLKVATADGTPAARKRWLGMFAFVVALLLPALAAAQAGAISVRDSVTGNSIPNIGNDANDALRVYCVGGTCSGGGGGGGGTSIADRAAFTFGVDNLTPIGGVFDDTPPSVLTTGMTGAARMTSRRALHVNLRDASGSELTSFPVTGTFWPVTQPVSGTFWQATQPVSGTFWQATQPVSNAGTFSVQCTSGCGGSSFLDNASFTFGTTPISPMGAVVDDVATNAAAENSAAAPRMSTRRELYSQLRDAAGNERGANVTAANALKVDGSAVTQPVSGTFWQATQPVSGTFWQATQPVSGTFWQATQPVSGTIAVSNSFLLDATFTGRTPASLGQKTMANSFAVTIASDQSAIPVTGTFWQATQPVSGTFWQATQPISAAALPLPAGASTLAEQQSQTTAVQLLDDTVYTDGVGTPSKALAVAGTDGTNPQIIKTDSDGNVQIECLAGCGGAAAFEDNDPFTFNTTAVGNIGAVVDDTASNAVTENSAGAVRMSTRRELYSQIRDAQGNERGAYVTTANALKTDASGSTVSQIASAVATATLQSAATAVGNGTAMTVTGYAEVVFTLTCTACGGGTTISFEISENGTDYGAHRAMLIGTGTMASSTTASGVTIWRVPVAGFQLFRARISSYVAGTITVTARSIPLAAYTGDVTVLGTTAVNVAQIAGLTAQSGNGSSAGALRVSVASDSTGILAAVTNVATIGTSVTPGTAATNLGKAEDAAHTTGDVGVAMLGVRNDATATTFGANNDYTPIAVDAQGAVFTRPSTRRAISISGQESIAAPTADVWYIRKQWALPSGAFYTPSHAWAAVTTALTKTTMVIVNNLGNLNVGTNTYTAANSVASPQFYGRLFGCVTTVLSATLDTITPTYTDELGNSQAATGVAFAASSPVGNCYEFPLAAGTPASALDSGVRAVTTAVDTAATTGVVTFYGVTVLADFAGTAAGQTETIEFPPATAPELEPNEQIMILMRQVLTNAQLKTYGIAGTLR